MELIRSERAFNGVPGEVMEKVVVAPAKDLSGLPLNRSRRRKLQEGFVVHLYAGVEEGYTLSRALKEVGGDKTRLVEIDLKRGADHDMMKDEVYAALMGAAFNGLVLGVVGGPNCRTRSVLRHYPLPAGKPRPVRGVAPEHWFGGEETGLGRRRSHVPHDHALLCGGRRKKESWTSWSSEDGGGIPAGATRRSAVHAGLRILVEDGQLPRPSGSAWVGGV